MLSEIISYSMIAPATGTKLKYLFNIRRGLRIGYQMVMVIRVFEIPKSIDYIMAPPRLQKYIDYSAEIYGIYLKYISKDDIYVYSIDEVFMDITSL